MVYNDIKMNERTSDDEQLAEAEYQGRWAARAGLSLEEFWPVWSRMAAKVGLSPWVGWGEAVDAFHAAAA
jgi:hypothetical protein